MVVAVSHSVIQIHGKCKKAKDSFLLASENAGRPTSNDKPHADSLP